VWGLTPETSNRHAWGDNVFIRRLAVLVAVLATCNVPEDLAAQANRIQVDGVRFGSTSAEAITVPYVIIGAGRQGSMLGGRLDLSGSIQFDVNAVDQSLINVEELTFNYGAGPLDFRIGVGDVSWGHSDVRSPVDVMAPRAVFLDAYNGARLGQPLLGLSAFSQWGDLEAVVFPFPRSPYMGGRLQRTWNGSSVRSELGWGESPIGGIRMTRVLGSTDIALSYVHGGERTLWISSDRPGEANVVIPSLRQGGLEVQLELGSVVLHTEGSLAERDGDNEARIVAGAEWYPKPYLTFMIEQGLTSLERSQASPLVDDIMLGGQLVTEEIRFSSQVFIDPDSGNQHYFVEARWTPTGRTAFELQLITWAGDTTQEPELALRQGNVLRASLLRYF